MHKYDFILKRWFGIDENDGTVYIKSSLDREVAQYVEITVFVEDLNATEPYKPQIASSTIYNLQFILRIF